MGSDYQPLIIIGLRLSKSCFYDEWTDHQNNCICKPKRGPGYDGSIAAGRAVPLDAKYCPDCGRTLAHPCLRSAPKEMLKADENWEDAWNKPLSFMGWNVLPGTNCDYFYIGFFTAKGHYGLGGSDMKHDLPDMSKLQQFREDMKEAGLWDEEHFGTWVVLYHSY